MTILYNQVVNFHCHLRNDNNFQEISQLPEIVFINNPLDENELNNHYFLINKYNIPKKQIRLSTGQHPLYPPDSITVEKTTSLLSNDEIVYIGEIGLDKRNNNFEWQSKVLIDFLDIAKQFNKPVILHCVGHFYELHKILKSNFPSLTYILHGFNESLEIIEKFKDLDVIYSLNSSITKVKNSLNILKEITDKNAYVFESDEGFNGSHDINIIKTFVENFLGKELSFLQNSNKLADFL